MKNRFLQKVLFGLLIATSAFLGSCSDDDEPVPEVVKVQFPIGENGFFIVNEGGFGNGDASLSYFNIDSNKVYNDIFLTYAKKPLGDQAQSMTVVDSLGFIVVQNSSKVEIIHAYKFSSVETITADEGVESPRYFIGVTDTKGYLSDWGADGFTGTVKVINLETFEVIKTIPTGHGANQMLLSGNKVYVANSGGWGTDKTIAVIDITTDEVVKKITVGDNPTNLVKDENNHIWVTGAGNLVYNSDWSIDEASSTPGFLAKINENDEVEFKLDAEQLDAGPGKLAINSAGTEIYYSYGGAVYKMSVSDTAFPESVFIDKSFYGLCVDPSTDNIIGTEAPNFSSAGTVYRYSSSGELIDNFTTGIAPNGCAFK